MIPGNGNIATRRAPKSAETARIAMRMESTIGWHRVRSKLLNRHNVLMPVLQVLGRVLRQVHSHSLEWRPRRAHFNRGVLDRHQSDGGLVDLRDLHAGFHGPAVSFPQEVNQRLADLDEKRKQPAGERKPAKLYDLGI